MRYARRWPTGFTLTRRAPCGLTSVPFRGPPGSGAMLGHGHTEE